MVTPLVPRLDDYDAIRSAFRWRIPGRLNIGVACCDVHVPSGLALVDVATDARREWTFGDLRDHSNRFAKALRGLGVARGDRVAFALPQGATAASAHLGTYKAGAVAVPLSELFGLDAIRHRLGDSGARVVVTGSRRCSRSSAPRPSTRCTTTTISRGGRSTSAARTGSFGRAARRPAPVRRASSAARWATSR
jgi:acetyl-CoA synthetase